MKTISGKLKSESGWQKLTTVIEQSFVKDTSYSLQVKNSGAFVSLSPEVPEGTDYFVLDELEKFNWTFDGTNELWVKPRSKGVSLVIVVS